MLSHAKHLKLKSFKGECKMYFKRYNPDGPDVCPIHANEHPNGLTNGPWKTVCTLLALGVDLTMSPRESYDPVTLVHLFVDYIN
jgi:hypothetical protein